MKHHRIIIRVEADGLPSTEIAWQAENENLSEVLVRHFLGAAVEAIVSQVMSNHKEIWP